MTSKLVTLAANADTGVVSIAAQADAKVVDIFTAAIDTNKTITGSYGLLQRLLLVEAGVILGGMSAGRGFVQAATFGKAG